MAVIHGNKSQGARSRSLADFKAGRVTVLVATDIAARGLDIAQLPLVVNYDLPLVAEDYIHRVGRTGRAGLAGRAISLVTASDAQLLRDIQRLLPAPSSRWLSKGSTHQPRQRMPVSAATTTNRPDAADTGQHRPTPGLARAGTTSDSWVGEIQLIGGYSGIEDPNAGDTIYSADDGAADSRGKPSLDTRIDRCRRVSMTFSPAA